MIRSLMFAIPETQPPRQRSRPHRDSVFRALAVPAPVRFAEVTLPASSSPSASGGELEVRLPDRTTVRGGSAAELAALVQALRS